MTDINQIDKHMNCEKDTYDYDDTINFELIIDSKEEIDSDSYIDEEVYADVEYTDEYISIFENDMQGDANYGSTSDNSNDDIINIADILEAEQNDEHIKDSENEIIVDNVDLAEQKQEDIESKNNEAEYSNYAKKSEVKGLKESDKRKRNKSNIIKSTNRRNEANITLYVVSDDKNTILHRYFNNLGLFPRVVSDDIEEAYNKYINDDGYCILVVVDSGTGRFSGTIARGVLINTIDISTYNIDKNIIIFYTDSTIKSEAERKYGKRNKRVEYCKYNGTADVVRYLLNKGIVFKEYDQEVNYIDINASNYLAKQYIGNKSNKVDFIVSEHIINTIKGWTSQENILKIVRGIYKRGRKTRGKIDVNDLLSGDINRYDVIESYKIFV